MERAGETTRPGARASMRRTSSVGRGRLPLKDAPRATAEVPHVTPSPSMPTPYWSANQWGMPGERSAQGSQEMAQRVMAIEQRMRAHLSAMANFNEDERMIILRAFTQHERAKREAGRYDPPELVTEREFRKVWRGLGVAVTKEEAHHFFLKYGCDQERRMPYNVFVQTLFGSQARLLGLTQVQKGPYKAGGDPSFRGKIIYRFCRKGVYTPTVWSDSLVERSAAAPQANLALEYVHGYAGIANTAPNLFYNCEGRAVFYTAAVGIVLDKEANTQRFFLGHDDDIRCLAMHPNRRLAATGQVASKDGPPCCVVWDTVTAEEVTRLSFHRVEGQSYNMVVAAAFSPCGTRLLVVTADVDHTVFVFEWQRRTCIFKSPGRRGDPPQIFGAAWNPFPRGNWSQKGGKTPAAGPYMFVTYGVKHLKVWSVAQDHTGKETYSPVQATFGGASVQDILSVCFLPFGRIAAGIASGDILLFDISGRVGPSSCVKREKAHTPGRRVRNIFDGQLVHAGVRALCLRNGNSELVSGGADGQLLYWNIVGGKLEGPSKATPLEEPGSAEAAAVRSLDSHPLTGDLLVGTSGCDVVEVVRAHGDEPVTLIDGHAGDLNGVAFLPKKPHKFATACESGVVSIWDARKRQLLAKVGVGVPSSCVDFSPNGLHMAVGGSEGSVLVLSTADLRKTLVTHKHALEGIHDVRYSPDGSRLAAGSHDNFVYLYDAGNHYALVAQCQGHSSYITHIDWRIDSRVLMSNSGAYEILYHDGETGRRAKGSQRDSSWATWTSVLGFPVMGIWRVGEKDTFDGTDINAVCRTHRPEDGSGVFPPDGGDLVVAASDDGMVRLFNYPCVVENAPCGEYSGHSAHVTGIRFSPDNTWVVSVGGRDRAVFQWRLVPGVPKAEAKRKLLDNFVYERPEKILIAETVPLPGEKRAAGQEAGAGGAGRQAGPKDSERKRVEIGEVEYVVDVVTSDIRGAGTDANVFVMLFGPKGSTTEIRLDNAKNNFERKRKDTFSIKARDVGVPDRIRIGHDNSGMAPGWHLDHVVVRNQLEKMAATFQCGRWFATDEDDGQIVRTLTTDSYKGPKPRQHVIEVHTSDVKGAGTDASVSITLQGSEGSFGPFRLESSKNDFERNHVDTFACECLVGDLESIQIGHDGSGLGSAWHLNKVIVTPAGGKPVVFEHDDWIPKDSGASTTVTLFPSDGTKRPSMDVVVYVHTSDIRGAGTDANVTLTLVGERNRSFGPVQLENSANNFERGAKDVFMLGNIPDIGAIHEIEIGHDGKGFASSWHLEEVVVNATSSDPPANKRFSFVADRWLDKETPRVRLKEGVSADGTNTYRVTTYTSDIRGAGTDANVFIILKGEDERGRPTQSDRIVLDNSSNNFERGTEDTFLLKKVPTVGRIKSIVIGHDNKGLGPGWHLDHVRVEDIGRKEDLYFDCRKWFDKKEDDKLIERELVPGGPAVTGKGEKVYKVTVTTSDVKGAGTDADVFVEIMGKAEDGSTTTSGRVELKSSKNDFERGRTDTYNVICRPLGKIERLHIGHNNRGLGPGWHLNRVEVRDMDQGSPVVFVADRWLDTKEPPGTTECLLFPQGSEGAEAQAAKYKVTVHTSDVRGAGTDAGVSVCLEGEGGAKSRVIELDGGKEAFERRGEDNFVVSTAPLGKITALTIGHDNRGLAPAWHLSHVEVRDLATGERFVFFYGDWLDAKKGQTTVRLLPGGSGPEKPARYEVRVKTTDKRGAGTDKDVSIMLIGAQGRTEEMALESSSDDFERGRLDKFIVQVPPGLKLGALEAVDIGFASRQGLGGTLGGMFGAVWLVDYVEVVELAESAETFFFPFFARVDRSKPRVSAKRGSHADAPAGDQEYRVVVRTSDLRGAGTDANVSLTVYGEVGGKAVDSGAKKLDSAENNFERGRKDEFTVLSPPLGTITRCEVSSDGRGLGGAWHLESVEIEDLRSGRAYFFPCGRWLTSSDPSSLTQVLMPSTSGPAAASLVEYVVTVVTGSDRGAGTDADVFLSMEGPGGAVRKRPLLCSGDPFERGQRDTFHVEGPDIGEVHRVTVEHNNKGMASRWQLDYVEVFSPTLARSFFFRHNGWLDTSNGCSVTLEAADKAPEEGRHRYTVATVTSDFRGAGTDSDVMMTLIGAKGDSGARLLESPTGKDVFERGQTDHFEVECGDLGEITAVKIANKGKGMFSAWHLARVEVTHLESGREYVFLCNEWLDKEHGLERTLLPSTKDGEAAREVWEEGTYEVRVFTSDIRGAGTDGDVSISIKGEDGFIGLQELPAKRQAFEKARADTFTLKGTRCGRLTEVEVALEPRGMASAWHLSRVEIIDRSDGRTYVFPCDQWLDGDHKRVTLLEGALAARKAEEAGVKAERKYVVRVWTGNRSGAGTDDKVFVEVKDSAGKLLGGRALQLDNSRNNFEQGQEDTFELAFPEEEAIGEKIEFLAVEKKAAMFSFGGNWFMDQISVTDVSQGQTYVWACREWFDKAKGCRKEWELSKQLAGAAQPLELTEGIVRVAQAPGQEASGREEAVPETKWKLGVHTAKGFFAGTDAEVHLELVDEKGEAWEPLLVQTKAMFEAGATDEFIVACPKQLGAIKTCRLWKVGRDKWNCEKVTAENLRTGALYEFSCRKAVPTSAGSSGAMELQASVLKEGREPEPPTDLHSSRDAPDPSAAAAAMPRDVAAGGPSDSIPPPRTGPIAPIGEIEAMGAPGPSTQAGAAEPAGDRRGTGEDAAAEPVRDRGGVREDDRKDAADRSAASDVGPSRPAEVETGETAVAGAAPEDPAMPGTTATTTEAKGSATYTLRITTGSGTGAGTDADVFVLLTDRDGKTWQPQLPRGKERKELFEECNVDTFTLPRSAGPMGDLSQAEVWIEGGGMLGFGDSWTLDGIEVVHEDSRRAWEFRPEQKRRVIRKGRDRSVIIKAAPLSADRLAGEPAAAPEADPGGQEGAKGGEEGPSSQGGNRGIEAVPRSEGEASDAPDGWGDGDDEYMVVVRTGDMDNAGTDAEVAIEIINEGLTLGFSPELRQGMESFERGAEDTFYTVSHQGDIGPLMCIRVYMLNPGDNWFLEDVTIEHVLTGRKYHFDCRQWIINEPLVVYEDRFRQARRTSEGLHAASTAVDQPGAPAAERAEEDTAAATIQAHYRGKKTRDALRTQREGARNQQDQAPSTASREGASGTVASREWATGTVASREAAARREDAAATKIQAAYRGSRDRRSVRRKREELRNRAEQPPAGEGGVGGGDITLDAATGLRMTGGDDIDDLDELEYVDTGLGLRDAAEEPDFGGVGDSWGSLGVGGGIGDGLDEIEELDDI